MPADAARADESEEGDARIGRQLLGQLVVLKEGSLTPALRQAGLAYQGDEIDAA